MSSPHPLSLLVLAVRGNHDPQTLLPSPFFDLHGQTRVIAGRTFGGLHGCCRYRPDGQFQLTQGEAASALSRIDHADVLLCHNSPAGVHEPASSESAFRAWAGRRFSPPVHHAGFTALRDFCERKHPALLLHGHQHVQRETVLPGGTRVVGVYGATRMYLN